MNEAGQLDCYASHTFGRDDSGRNVEHRIQLILSSLRQRNIAIKCSTDYLIGNILQIVHSGIETANCVLIFISNSYVRLVQSPMFSVCQLEFNTAIRLKSTNIVFVVLEKLLPWMHDSIVGLAMSSMMTIDFSEDSYFHEKCANLFAVTTKVINSSSATSPASSIRSNRTALRSAVKPAASLTANVVAYHQSPKHSEVARGSFPERDNNQDSQPVPIEVNTPLNRLTSSQVSILLDKLNMSAYKSAFADKGVTGAHLYFVQDEHTLIAMGISLITKAKLLFSRIQSYKLYGVPNDVVANEMVAGVLSPLNSAFPLQESNNGSPALIPRSDSPPVSANNNNALEVGANYYSNSSNPIAFSSPPKLAQASRAHLRGADSTGDDRELAMIMEQSNEDQSTSNSESLAGKSLFQSPVICERSASTSSIALLQVGTSVEARPKKIGTIDNYRYHKGVIVGMQSDCSTYDVQLENGALVTAIPRFAIMSIEEITAQRSKRLNDRQRNSASTASENSHISASQSPVATEESSLLSQSMLSTEKTLRSIAGLRVGRQMGNSEDDIRSLQRLVRK